MQSIINSLVFKIVILLKIFLQLYQKTVTQNYRTNKHLYKCRDNLFNISNLVIFIFLYLLIENYF